MEVYVVNSFILTKIGLCVHLFVYVLIVLINRLVILSMGNAITLAGGISENSFNGHFSNFRFSRV